MSLKVGSVRLRDRIPDLKGKSEPFIYKVNEQFAGFLSKVVTHRAML